MKEIKLTQDKVALVDDEDYEEVSAFNWHAFRGGKTFYAQRYIKLPNGREAMQLMHRQILGLAHGDKLQVDHKDRNSLNNTRENLRVATAAQNGANNGKQRGNKSGFKGVSWDRLARSETPRGSDVGSFCAT
jgi:AP2-like factor, euAP2 lineage